MNQRSGKWTVEEKRYADALVVEFETGTIDIDDGISLRRFLSSALCCSVKRISKKYEGSNYNGKMLYKKSRARLSPEKVQERRKILEGLEKSYQESLKVLKMLEEAKQNHLASSDVERASRGSGGRVPRSAWTEMISTRPQSANMHLPSFGSVGSAMMSPFQLTPVGEKRVRIEAHSSGAFSPPRLFASVNSMESYIHGDTRSHSSSKSSQLGTASLNRDVYLKSVGMNSFLSPAAGLVSQEAGIPIPSLSLSNAALRAALSEPRVSSFTGLPVPAFVHQAPVWDFWTRRALLAARLTAVVRDPGDTDPVNATNTGVGGSLFCSWKQERNDMQIASLASTVNKNHQYIGQKRESDDSSLPQERQIKFPRLL